MKNVPLYTLALAALSLAGCAPKEAEAPATTPPAATTSSTEPGATSTAAVVTGHPLGTLKVGGRAVCAICAVKEGTKATEKVKDTLDYKGKTYGFCNESEKAEFISAPAKYAQE